MSAGSAGGSDGSRPAAPNPYALGANPYDPSTWNGKGSARSDAPAGTAPGQRGPAAGPPAGLAPGERGQAAGGAEDWETARPGSSAAPREEPGAIRYDPVDPPRGTDTFELARRTVNRSRAAARDRGLFPISAKTQMREARDRSATSPGFSGARPDARDPQTLENVMRRVLGDLGWNDGMNAGRVLEEWDDIVGPQVSAHCRPVSLDEGVLVVSASSSAWATQLRMISPQLITTIHDHVGAHVISELRVTGPAAAQRTWKKGKRTVTWRGPRDTYG